MYVVGEYAYIYMCISKNIYNVREGSMCMRGPESIMSAPHITHQRSDSP